MIEVPLQVIDNLLRPYNVGHVLLAVLVLAILGSLPLKSAKVLAINVVAVGTIFLLAPTDIVGQTPLFRLAGVGLIVVGPMIYVASRE